MAKFLYKMAKFFTGKALFSAKYGCIRVIRMVKFLTPIINEDNTEYFNS